MLVYKDMLAKLKAAGYSSYRLRKEKLLSEETISTIRNNGTITSKTIDTVCRLANCQPGDILEYVPDSNTSEE